MAMDPKKFEEFDGKQVILHKIVDGDIVELEGKVEAAGEHGIAFKEKGKRDLDLVEPHQVEEIALAPVKPKSLPQKKLKAVTLSTVRQHLLDRHGLLRSEANAMSDDEAWELHESISHDDQGHRHLDEDGNDPKNTDADADEGDETSDDEA